MCIDYGRSLEEMGIADWRREPIAGSPEMLLFWKPHHPEVEQHGFEFHCVAWTSSDADGGNPTYATLFDGVAHYDGVRHMHFGDESRDELGYLCYADVPRLIDALKRLDEIQVNQCWYAKADREAAVEHRK